jgi:hypothetical protein
MQSKVCEKVGRIRMHRKVFLTLAALCCLASLARADLTIVVGEHILQPNTPHQAIQIFVTGGTQVAGADFVVQVGDGGPLNSFTGPGNISGPTITADVLTGTIFASNHNPLTTPDGGASGPQTVYLGITTASGTVAGAGLFGTIFVDTTGWTAGNQPLLNGVGPAKGWELNMGGGQGVWDNPSDPLNIATFGGQNMLPTNTDFPPLSVGTGLNIIDGHISIIPEPSSVVMGLFAAAGLGIVAIRKHRARRA